ncbi:hypothetical protein E0D86_13805 [Pseudomonas sp. IC_126]|uniref:nSTAND1 domain-containing NTPase n=1 Tax=Pseudomonas sp. IC_126 TaxID=2547400 RepID=UPI00103F1EEC|nr:restriction endonuclease [Pseudomonas sp. IC_126]TCD20492.1 hypothetical protein E0D86_13805 [Pseudomonas sp. IC_126]
MFLFFHGLQTEENASFYKGTLFEKLLAAYLDQSGYNVELRKKHASLEYDIEGTSRATGQKIIGEAKAHSKSMSGQVVSAFVGKLIPLGLLNKRIHGLFLSLSPMTPEADNYFSTVKDLGLSAKTGSTLYDEISTSLKLPSETELAKKIERLSHSIVANNILTTENGYYKLAILKRTDSGTPSSFAVFSESGDFVQDKIFCEKLRDSLPELSGLEPAVISASSKTITNENRPREIQRGLPVGTDWADYRLPAGPGVFVGRKAFVEELSEHIEGNHIPNVIQVKSRSGVGKSSVISFFENKLSSLGHVTELHDSRDVKTVYDIFSLVARFTQSLKIPTSYIEIDEALAELQERLNGRKAVFFVDQFESTFINPEIYDCYEYIASALTKLNGSAYIVVARKNDQLTTYDDTKVSLGRINSISKSYTLPDFERDESILLLEKINENNNYVLSKEILPYIIEFAQGFPWLLKRTIAHVLKLTKQGDSHRDLIGSGLKLNDLFEEELEGLDEFEKGYLTKIASKLPADFKELQYQFDEDPMLVKVLDKLTTSRLVRLSGSTYDTYNDVFKEYLIYQKLPEFRLLTIYRMYPGAVISLFRKVISAHHINIDYLKNELDVSEGYAFNLVKEFRNLDLVEASTTGQWIIPAKIKDLYSQGQLAGYLRRKLMDNTLVESLLGRLLAGEQILENDLPSLFSTSYPYIEASDNTWRLYSTILKSWLLSLKILTVDKNGILRTTDYSHAQAAAELGNLKQISGLRSGNKGLFFPVTSFSKMKDVTLQLIDGIDPTDKEGIKAKGDLRNSGVLVGTQLAVSDTDELAEALTGQLLDDGYAALWEAINNGQPCLEVFTKIAGEGLTLATVKWRLKKVTALAKKLGIIPEKRFKY